MEVRASVGCQLEDRWEQPVSWYLLPLVTTHMDVHPGGTGLFVQPDWTADTTSSTGNYKDTSKTQNSRRIRKDRERTIV